MAACSAHKPIFRMPARHLPRLLAFALLAQAALTGCIGARHAPQPGPAPRERTTTGSPDGADLKKILALQSDLAGLDQGVDVAEAQQVAQTAICYSRHLAEQYELVRPAVLHNLLVRAGLKKRGLCYHWTEDLLKRLQALDLKTYRLYWGVAYRGSELYEHNSVVIAARRQGFDRGIVLDPWRNSGDLYWCTVVSDRYPWQLRRPDE